MKKTLKKIIPSSIYNMALPYWKQLSVFNILSKQYGQFQSIKKWKCIDKTKNPIPWYTYPAIEYLSNLDFSKKTILEWGGGNSSLFWSKRCKKLITVENDSEWFKTIEKNKNKNQEIYLLQDIDSYPTLPLSLSYEFDVFIIDGKWRKQCADVVMQLIQQKPLNQFLIIFDNSDRHQDITKKLRDIGLIEIDFHGFAPINSYTHTTSIFLSRNFNFIPLNDFQPHYSIASLKEKGEQ